RFSLLIHPDMIDFNRPIHVVVNGKTVYRDVIKPDHRVLLEEARRRPDPEQLVGAILEVDLSR
ncbi:MAG TPA: hypothetical protein VLB09_08020, partial [Nitrospiria bacterium]|nr:hypothetical protein [Nitrospiria bacterium]